MTITPDPGDSEPPIRGWGNLIKFLVPAFYDERWAPWLRIVATGVLVFGAVVVWHLML